MKYFVKTTVRRVGKDFVVLMSSEEAKKNGYRDGYHSENSQSEIYVNGFESLQDARKFMAVQQGHRQEQDL